MIKKFTRRIEDGVFCCLIVIIVIIFYAVSNVIESEEEKVRKAEKVRAALEEYRKTLNKEMNNMIQSEENIIKTVQEFFIGYGIYNSLYENIMGVSVEMENNLERMKENISLMKKTNKELAKLVSKEDQSARIESEEKEMIYEKAPQIILNVKNIAKGLITFRDNIYTLPFSRMMDGSNYGKINKDYWNYWNILCNGKRNIAVSMIELCNNRLEQNCVNSMQVHDIFTIDIDSVLACVWLFATENTFVASDFQRAVNTFNRVYKDHYADIIIAELYVKKKVGGEEALREAIQNLLKLNLSSEILTLIASSLMWMNSYQGENMVLQYMLATGKEMSAKAQERLHSLTNGGGKAPGGFEVKSSDKVLYFDVSALAWRDEEYVGLFENLAFQDKVLTYSLAIREENKDLFVSQGINIPDKQNILNKFKAVFEEEYGSSIKVNTVNGVALSGSGEEKMEGVLVISAECKQMGILMHIAKIGKKLIIKFYTLFMPTDVNLTVQKQQALSMYKKLSPSVTMWEDSLKDTMLIAVEQLLNTTAISFDDKESIVWNMEKQVSKETVF